MRNYEMMFIFSSKLDKSAVDEEITKIKSQFSDAKIRKEDNWGLKEFAYPIKKESKGYYYILYIETEYENVANLKESLRFSTSVLRHLIIKHNKWPFDFESSRKEEANG